MTTETSATKRQPKVLAVASGGGHFVQLRRMRAAWEGCRVAYVTTNPGYRAAVEADHGAPGFYVVPDANRWQKLRLLRQLLAILWIMLRERPDVVISTGAAPGYFALRAGRLFGARTVWVDSIANSEELSLSGRAAGKHAHLFLTQWEHLSQESGDGPKFRGAVL